MNPFRWFGRKSKPVNTETFEQFYARHVATWAAHQAEFEREYERKRRAKHPEDYPRPTSFYFFGASGPRT